MTSRSYAVRDKFSNLNAQIVVNEHESPDWEARLACALIERWGLVAGEIDGEDSGGRQKFRRLTPTELVTEACSTAELAISEFRRRGWVLALPTIEEAEKLLAERENVHESSATKGHSRD